MSNKARLKKNHPIYDKKHSSLMNREKTDWISNGISGQYKEKGDSAISPIINFHEELISLNKKNGTLNRTITFVEFIGLLELRFKQKELFLGPAKQGFSFFSRE